jgi:hypothetical protein
MSAIIPQSGKARQLDRRPEPDEQITEEHAKDPARVARLLMRILRDIAQLKRRWWPRRVDHEDRVVDDSGAAKHRFPHGFNGRVRWWVVDWVGEAGDNHSLQRHSDTDENTLVLTSRAAGMVTLRIEVAG